MLAAWSGGAGLSRWLSGETGRIVEAARVLAAALVLATWGTIAGTIVSGPADTFVGQIAALPSGAGPLARVAALWATPRGMALTTALVLLLLGTLSPVLARRLPREVAGRHSTVLLLTGVMGLAAALLAPMPVVTGSVPVFAQAIPAALAPAAALLALACLADLLALAVASARGPAPDGVQTRWRSVSLVALILATVSTGAEQVARSDLGIGPRQAVVPGGASAGLVLWMIAALVVHRVVRRSFLSGGSEAGSGKSLWAGRLAHTGAGVMALSFLAHVAAARATVTLPPAGAVAVRDVFGREWQLRNQGVSRFDARDADVTSLAVSAAGPNGVPHLLISERREYRSLLGGNLAPVVTRGVVTTPLQTAGVLLEAASPGDAVRVRVSFIPLSLLWPIGLALLGAGLVTALTYSLRRGTSFRRK